MTKAFYGSSQWTEELAGLVRPLMADLTVALIEDAPGFRDRWPS
jgi:hypothetical protein